MYQFNKFSFLKRLPKISDMYYSLTEMKVIVTVMTKIILHQELLSFTIFFV